MSATAPTLAPEGPEPSHPVPSGSIHLESTLVHRAKDDDAAAIEEVFRQFVPQGEKILDVQYLGYLGFLMGRHSMMCVSERRVADVTIGWFGEVIYQDAFLESVNSSIITQPSRLGLYVLLFAGLLLHSALSFFIYVAGYFQIMAGVFGRFPSSSMEPAFFAGAYFLVAGILLTEMIVRLFYRFAKCGVICSVKQGINLYAFSDRKRLQQANRLVRLATDFRDTRIQKLGHIG